MRKLLCNHKISAQNYVNCLLLVFFLLFGQNPALYMRERERERERERGLSYNQYNFCEQKEVALTLSFLGPLRGDNGHEFKANPSGVLLWGQALGSFLLNGSFRFWIHGLKVWIYMSSGFWVLDSGWVVDISYLVGFGQRTLGLKLGW